MQDSAPMDALADASQRIVILEQDKAALASKLQQAETALANLQRAYTRVLEQLSLLHRRLFVAKAERADASADQLAFDGLLAEAERLAKAIDQASPPDAAGSPPSGDSGSKGKGDRPSKPPTGRRDLADSDLPVVRVEVTDPELEGTAERIGFEESSQLGYERGGMRRVVIARVVYKVTDAPTEAVAATAPSADGPSPAATPAPGQGASCAEGVAETVSADTAPTVPKSGAIVVTPVPKQLFRRALLAPSMIAHVLVSKYLLGVPFYRLEQSFALRGARLDRGTMCRYAEDAGATLGAIVEAARVDAFANAFCLSTDATGVSIQPGHLAGRQRGPCRKGHFFVVLADRDHIFFEFQAKHTSAAVCQMFKGFRGYIQADAHVIYDALFRPNPASARPPDSDSESLVPTEVGCWSHCRRHFWEAAVCKHELGVEGMRRIDAMFAAERLLADLAPAERKARRDTDLRPMLDRFFEWVEALDATPRPRGLVRSALGYARRHRAALRRFLDDGRLLMDNNSAERALRTIASARNYVQFPVMWSAAWRRPSSKAWEIARCA